MTIEAKNLVKEYMRGSRKIEVLNSVSFTISSGEFIGITGRSGSGKSTLINIIAGLIKPTRGSVLLDGEDIFTLSDEKLSLYRNAKICCVPQGQSVLSNLNVLDNVRLPSYLSKRDGDNSEEAYELLKLFQIEKLAESMPKCLSGGELKRVAIARAMMNKPDFLLVDEPTGELDADTAKMIMNIFRNLADNGASVLMITHEPDSVEYVDMLYLMSNGVLTQS